MHFSFFGSLPELRSSILYPPLPLVFYIFIYYITYYISVDGPSFILVCHPTPLHVNYVCPEQICTPLCLISDLISSCYFKVLVTHVINYGTQRHR